MSLLQLSEKLHKLLLFCWADSLPGGTQRTPGHFGKTKTRVGDAIVPEVNKAEYPTEATLGNQGLRGFERPSRELLAQSLGPADLHRRIAKVAYELYLGRGGSHGHDLDIGLSLSVLSIFNWRKKDASWKAERLRCD